MLFQVTINTQQKHPVITLKNNNCSVEIYAFGGFLNAFFVTTKNGVLNVVDGFSSVKDAIQNITPGFKGGFLSPFTCRMNNGQYEYNGVDYTIEKFYMQSHAIHGILYDAVYNIVAVEANDDKAFVTLEFNYNGQDKGYPFPFTVSHTWLLEVGNKLSVTTTCTHSNAQSIPYAQGWHPYFKLGGCIDDYTIQFDSNKMLEFDNTLLPTGKYITRDEFANGTLLKDIILDNCFELSKTTNQPKCVLNHDEVTITILPDSNYPYFQIFTPPHRQSIALENLSGAPDCFNNGIGLRLIEPHASTIFTNSYIVIATNS